MAADALRSKTLINIDNEDESQFVSSSAGGIDVNVSASYAEQATCAGLTGLSVAIDDLIGGHSGMDTNKGRGSPHQLMARRLVRLTGGTLKNDIPSATQVELAPPSSKPPR